MPKTLILALATTLIAAPALGQQSRPDTEFCAKVRAKDPGGICTPKGEYVTPDKAYLPDGRVINRTAGATK